MIHPATIHEVVRYGRAGMGDVTDPTSVARFGLRDAATGFSLKSLVVKAISGSDGDNTMSLMVDHPSGEDFDYTPYFWDNFGLGATAVKEVFARWSGDELADIAIYRDPSSSEIGEFCLTWTNPSTIPWMAIARLVDHADIPDHPSTLQRV